LKKFIAVTLVAVLLCPIFISCQSTEAIVTSTDVVKTDIVTQTTTITGQPITTTKVVTTTIPSIIIYDPKSRNRYTIEQGKVGLANNYIVVKGIVAGGASPSRTFYIINGSDELKTYCINVKPFQQDGYEPAPNNISDWVILVYGTTDYISTENGVTVLVPSMSAVPIDVTLAIPVDAELPQKWEFIVSVVEYPRVIATDGFVSLSYEVNETSIDFNWNLLDIPIDTNTSGGHINISGYPKNVMIRSKVGGYPVTPTDKNIAPSDGELIYYGDGVKSITDMSYSPFKFYRLWVQKVDGTWHTASGITTLLENTCTVLVQMGR